MKKDQIVLLKDRGLITVYGEDSKSFLQNIITNDVYKVNSSNTIFSALFTPQGKYLFEFFLLQSKKGYIIECDNKFTIEIIHHLLKYKLKSKIEIKDASQEYVVGVVSLEKFMGICINSILFNVVTKNAFNTYPCRAFHVPQNNHKEILGRQAN